MSFDLGVFQRHPSTPDVASESVDAEDVARREAEELATASLPPDPGTAFPHLRQLESLQAFLAEHGYCPVCGRRSG